MKINYNVSAMLANNALARNDGALSKSLERLSSGYKINQAKDNAAGLAIARRMNAQIEGLSIAGDNANEGVSIIEIADGAMSEVHDILQRMNELAVKASNGTLSDNDRATIDKEYQQLKEETERIGTTTQFNGQNLLDGSFDLKGYSNQSGVKVEYYATETPFGKYNVNITPVYEMTEDADGNQVETENLTNQTTVTIQGTDGNVWAGEVRVSADRDKITLKGEGGFEVRLVLDKTEMTNDGATPPTYDAYTATIDLTGIGSMTVQIGANEGQTMELRMPPITKANLGIEESNVLTDEDSLKAIDEVANAIAFVSGIRSDLGAYQNRLEHTGSSLDITHEEMTSAYSRIMDVDMATEMTKYSSLQVVSQAATSILAQANQRPSQVLQLLQ